MDAKGVKWVVYFMGIYADRWLANRHPGGYTIHVQEDSIFASLDETRSKARYPYSGCLLSPKKKEAKVNAVAKKPALPYFEVTEGNTRADLKLRQWSQKVPMDTRLRVAS